MASYKKYAPYLFAGIALVALFLATRLTNILTLPVFTDEAIYLRWAQIANQDASWRFISLTDGKQPLFIWLTMAAMRVLDDPLLAGRVVSVAAGLATSVGLFLLGATLFKNIKVGLITSLLYVISPFALVYDRLALYDALVSTFAVWIAFLTVLMVRYLRLDTAMILGITAGLAVLNKSSGFFGIYLLPFSAVLLNTDKIGRKKRFLKWTGLAIIAAIFTYAVYAILRLSPYFYLIGQKNETFIFSFSEWLEDPFARVWGNLIQGQLTWLIEYMTIPVVLLVIAALIIDKKFIREKLYLLIIFAAPFVALGLFGRVIYPRYILFMTMPLLPLAAYAVWALHARLKNKFVYATALIAVVLFPLFSMYFILFDFEKAPIPQSDINQFKTGWPAGVGVNESIEYIREVAENEKVYLATQGTFGLMPYAYELYLSDHPNVTIQGVWPIEDDLPQEVVEASQDMPTFFVFYQPCSACSAGQAPESWPVTEVMKIEKGEGEIDFRLYKVISE